ncbi:3-phosphoshikimate 1-carboxyvinyltransferase [bioreactor metagenome]|uniref:3-phosphoshikimate 1-carboxyvinyltransferase n=1 Tax=bioreactor metagenome TaxID=1076179 RepID=A0A645BRM8_9ZZZZ
MDDSEDMRATRRCMEALQAPGDALPLLDCGESGSTLRFLIPLSLVLRGGAVFTGQGRLMERPLEPYARLFAEKGVAFTQENGLCTVKGALPPGLYRLPGDVSSQFITGLLYALPLLTGGSELELTTELESGGYVDLTLDALARFGVTVSYDGGRRYRIAGGQTYRPAQVTVEADYSQTAFFCAANALGGSVELLNLNPDSAQGDRVILEYTRRLAEAGEVTLDVSQCPDLVPALALMAALRAGERTRIVNAGRLRIKESDRLETVTTELTALGARITQTPDSLVLEGVSSLKGGVTVRGHNDHRIAMMLGIAAAGADAPFTLLDAQCVAKSYPGFWSDYRVLGGRFEEVSP